LNVFAAASKGLLSLCEYSLINTTAALYQVFAKLDTLHYMGRVYEDHIRNVAASLSLKVARADDFLTVHAVMQDIWTAICRSRIIIADCTSKNPNVFYEIGIAHTVGKPVLDAVRLLIIDT
jgi:hypothetical protein